MQLLHARHHTRSAGGAGGHGQPETNRKSDQNERNDPESTAGEPEDVLARIGVRAHAGTASAICDRAVNGPNSWTDPSSRTISPPAGARIFAAPSGPERNAILARVSASSALTPSAVA